ncbi:MAG: hypothetical protein IT337_10820 [Thermomicrobiales bacterium]|nr:hypothetical protein [Thermomicrobiales bacterium]
MARIDWLTLFLAYSSPDGDPPEPLDRLAIQKGLYLLREVAQLPTEEAYDFAPYRYGTYSVDVLDDLETLVATGQLGQKGIRGTARYFPTVAFIGRAAVVAERGAPPETLALIEVLRALLRDLSFDQTLAAMYAAYPETGERTERPDYLPCGTRAATGDLATLFTPESLRSRAEVLLNRRAIAAGHFRTLDQLAG